MKSDDDLTIARAQATQEIAAAVLKATGAVMTSHGPDPQGGVIVAAGFAMALQRAGEAIDPRIPMVVREMLGAPAA